MGRSEGFDGFRFRRLPRSFWRTTGRANFRRRSFLLFRYHERSPLRRRCLNHILHLTRFILRLGRFYPHCLSCLLAFTCLLFSPVSSRKHVESSHLRRAGSGVFSFFQPFGGAPERCLVVCRQLQDRFLPDLLQGKKRICIAITEPTAGSDVANIQTSAVRSRDGKHFIVNGSKKWSVCQLFSYLLPG